MENNLPPGIQLSDIPGMYSDGAEGERERFEVFWQQLFSACSKSDRIDLPEIELLDVRQPGSGYWHVLNIDIRRVADNRESKLALADLLEYTAKALRALSGGSV